ncbi:MAG: tetratricopeptide repeat protein [Gammaproteobacteria bacterium]|nr:tetratricopeptide repeat protein [Gammaproteobacteria bacterium]MDE2346575.1 tetratricopeptide repeat protein [Gammaproteobacteria bacterium]
MTEQPTSFLARLKKHHIYRVATIYAIASWVLIQLSNGLLPDFGLPRSSVVIVIAVIALGFPVVLVLAWMLIRPVDPEKLARWQRRRWRIGPILSLIVISFAAFWIIIIWGKISAETAASAAKTTVSQEVAAFHPPPHSIAVLPFQNLSNNPKQQYFSDGITQELTNALGQIPGLQVIAWQSVASFSNTTLSANTIGKELDVAYMLVGSVMRAGDSLRVYAELVNTSTGYQIWSDKYDRSIKDIFAVQDEISKAIASSMQLELGESTHLVSAATTSTDAHDAYLKGMEYFNLRTKANLYRAIKYFQKAVELDKNYSEAYAQLASAYTVLPEVTSMSYEEANAKAMPLIRKSLEINPNQPKAHAVLANIYITEHKTEAAKAELLKTLALDPNDAAVHTYYAFLLPLKEALGQYQIAATLDPEYWAVQMNLGAAYAELGHFAQAIKAYQAAQHLSPENIEAPLEIAFLNHLQSKDKESVRILTSVTTSNRDDSEVLDASRLSYAALLDPKLRSQALNNLDKLTGSKNGGFNQYYLATAYIVLGDDAKAIQLIRNFCGNTPDSCNDIAVDPHYLSLHANKEFQRLVARYGLKH